MCGEEFSTYTNKKYIPVLVVIKDYESAFDAVTLTQIPKMIYQSDFQPQSIAEIKNFSSTTTILQKIFSDKSIFITNIILSRKLKYK